MDVSGTRRAIVLVIDALGVGALPDAERYGDAGTNTLAHVAEAVGGLTLPTLGALGLGAIVPARGLPADGGSAICGRLAPLGPGKDSITGHWELMGVVLPRALPTYPDGFPPQLLARLTAAMGRAVMCNRPDDGLSAIEQFGAEHLRSGALILYTSQDSVLQLAAHVERVPVQELYRACERARETMSGEHAVGRVIARPFEGVPGAFRRTAGRRDLALAPPTRSYLLELQDAGVEVHAVGKIADLFAGVGIDRRYPGADNAQALASTEAVLSGLRRGLLFVNLIETDQVYGHRKDAAGFARALAEIDRCLAGLLAGLGEQDLLIVTADHGVDPAHPGTDHTREYAPLLALTGAMRARGAAGDSAVRAPRAARERAHALHEGPLADVGATVLRWLAGRESEELPGRALAL